MKKTSLSLIATAMILAGCDSSGKNDTATAQATSVTVSVAKDIQHTPTRYYVGRMQAIESANLTPRVSGFLLNKRFEDDALVKKGDVLFDIDPTSYQAALDAANATLNEAKAALNLATLNLERNQNMLNTGGMSQAQLDLSLAEVEMARARVVSAKANVVVQQDNLDQTQVKAPYSGRIGKSNFSIGDIVGQNVGPLTDLIQVSPIEANFALKETEIGSLLLEGNDSVRVSLEVNGEATGLTGNISFVDNKINPTSGTINVAAQFDNSDAALTPNQYVRVGLSPQHPVSAVEIPHKAIHQDHVTQYVFIVEEDAVARRDVEVSDRAGQTSIVTSGLDAGEPVIIGGLQRVRVGAPVIISE